MFYGHANKAQVLLIYEGSLTELLSIVGFFYWSNNKTTTPLAEFSGVYCFATG